MAASSIGLVETRAGFPEQSGNRDDRIGAGGFKGRGPDRPTGKSV